MNSIATIHACNDVIFKDSYELRIHQLRRHAWKKTNEPLNDRQALYEISNVLTQEIPRFTRESSGGLEFGQPLDKDHHQMDIKNISKSSRENRPSVAGD